MNLVELITFLSFIASGYFCGKLLGFYFGIVGWLIGFILGCSLFVGLFVLLQYWLFLRYILEPPYPRCRNEDCGLEYAYTQIESSLEGEIIQCQCGAKYLCSATQFMEIRENGEKRKYLKREISFLGFVRGKSRWVKEVENGSVSPAADGE